MVTEKYFLTAEYVEQQRLLLLARLESKRKIMAEGGEQSLAHSSIDISRISFALRRINEKQYGLCVPCGVTIELERLQFSPETPFCAACARKY